MSDIVGRLRGEERFTDLPLRLEAADRIEQLEAEILSLHNLLTKWSDANNEMADRIVDAEIALNVWDKSHASEYWLRWRPCR